METSTDIGDKILCYLGPTLALTKAREILPNALYKAPARQGDILSDVVNLEPEYVLLGDGEFENNLSVWHKEIVYALQCPSVKGVYGFSSMGALRASELDFVGMVGLGKIYQWYRDRVTEDDSEVALSYSELEGVYRPVSVPLINIRAGIHALCEALRSAQIEKSGPDPEALTEFLNTLRQVPYFERTPQFCQAAWIDAGGRNQFPYHDQKAEDAAYALGAFRAHRPEPRYEPTAEHLTQFFEALYDRDRRVSVAGVEVRQQHIDSYVLLHHPEYERICWDSANQELALMLCNLLSVMVAPEEIDRESERFQARAGVKRPEDFEAMLSANGWSRPEYDRLMIQNARIHKLQHALTVTKAYRRNTAAVLDYLRTHQAYDYWARAAVSLEEKIRKSGVDDWLGIDLEQTPWSLLHKHADREALEVTANQEEYLLETGFSNPADLGVALARINAGKLEDSKNG